MSSPWRKGWQLEDRVRKDLTRCGYVDVVRSPLSRGPADITATRADVRVCVQCKSANYCSPAEWNALYQLAEQRGAVAVIAGKDPHGHLVYHVLTGPKTTRGRQPWQHFDPAPVRQLELSA